MHAGFRLWGGQAGAASYSRPSGQFRTRKIIVGPSAYANTASDRRSLTVANFSLGCTIDKASFRGTQESPSRTGIVRETRALPSAEPGPSMFPSEIKDWANGNNAARINLLVRHVVMPLDVIEVHRLGNAIMLV